MRMSTKGAVYALAALGQRAASLAVYDGGPPQSPDADPTGTLIATLEITGFSEAGPGGDGAVATVQFAGAATVASAGFPGWARMLDASGDGIADFTITGFGDTGLSGDLVISATFVDTTAALTCAGLAITLASG